jgi:hypothetical protein
MQTQEFTLPNGGTPAAGQPDTGIFVLLNGEPLAGPIQEQHARIRTTCRAGGAAWSATSTRRDLRGQPGWLSGRAERNGTQACLPLTHVAIQPTATDRYRCHHGYPVHGDRCLGPDARPRTRRPGRWRHHSRHPALRRHRRALHHRRLPQPLPLSANAARTNPTARLSTDSWPARSR